MLAEAVAVSRAAGICNAYTIPCHAWLATAYRLAAVQHAYDLSDRGRYLELARRQVRAGLRATSICKNDLPHLLREQALVSALRGRTKAAVRALLKSIQWAERLKMADEQLQNAAALETLGIANQPEWRRRLSLATDRLWSLPVLVLMPHGGCNCRCVMCDIWRSNAAGIRLSVEQIEAQLPALDRLRVRWVVLSGGEVVVAGGRVVFGG